MISNIQHYEVELRRVLRVFYDRVLIDPMIGYLFAGKDHEQLIERQFEFTFRMLGGAIKYQGQPLPQVHRPLQIRMGHFGRRHMLLIEALKESTLPDEIKTKWLEHDLALRTTILDRPQDRK